MPASSGRGSASRLLSRCFPIVLLGLLLSFPALSVKGAADGLLLWFNIVLPTLSPFIICTQMVVALGGADLLTRPFYPAAHSLFGLSRPGTYVLLCGLLCGYPLGAKMCGDFLMRGEITQTEAEYLLSICNHPSPMFLLGFVGARLQHTLSPVFLLACFYLPVIPVSLLSRRVIHLEKDSRTPWQTCPDGLCHPSKNYNGRGASLHGRDDGHHRGLHHAVFHPCPMGSADPCAPPGIYGIPGRNRGDHHRGKPDLHGDAATDRRPAGGRHRGLWRVFRNLPDKERNKKRRTIHPALFILENHPYVMYLCGIYSSVCGCSSLAVTPAASSLRLEETMS